MRRLLPALTFFICAAAIAAAPEARSERWSPLISEQGTNPPVLARIEVSSELDGHGIGLAFDVDATTSWCPKSSDPLGELAVIFPSPVSLASVSVWAGDEHATGPRPTKMDFVVDDFTLLTNPDEDGDGARSPDELQGRVTRRVAIRLPPAAAGEQRCLKDVAIRLRDGPWVFGLTPGAVKALPGAIANLTAALRECDPGKLSKLARFPARFRERSDIPELHWSTDEESWHNAKDLAEHCGTILFSDTDKRKPRIDQSVGPDNVRVLGGVSIGAAYWFLSWSKQRWWLVGAENTHWE